MWKKSHRQSRGAKHRGAYSPVEPAIGGFCISGLAQTTSLGAKTAMFGKSEKSDLLKLTIC